MKAGKVRPSTQTLYAGTLDDYIIPALGDHYVDAITPADVQAWFDAQVGAPATVNGRLRLLRTILRAAKRLRLIPADPSEGVEFRIDQRPEEGSTKVLSASELGALLEAVRTGSPAWYPLVLTLATTGARYGEVSALLWEDVDLDARVLRLRKAQWRGHVGQTKTRRVRTVPIAAELVDVLKAHRADLLRRQAPGLDKGLVFPSAEGTHGQPSAVRKPLLKAALATELARFEGEGDERRVVGRVPTAHWFRHTLNDLLRRTAAGEVTRSITGHVTEEMTEHYSRITLDERRAALGAVLRHVLRTGGKTGGRTPE